MNAVSNFLLPGVALSASEDLEGKAIPISNSFLMFGKNQQQQILKRQQNHQMYFWQYRHFSYPPVLMLFVYC